MPYLLAAAIAAIALILTPGIFFSFDVTPKLIVLLTASALASYPLRRSKLLWLTIASVLCLAASTALSPSPALSFYGAAWRRYGALAQLAVLLLAWSLSGQARHTSAILRIVSGAGAITAIYGIAQYLGWDPILPAALYHIGEGIWTIVRPPSTLGHASYFATWLVFAIFLSLAVPGRLAKGIAALALVAMVLTGTRAALLGLVAGAAVWLFWRDFRVTRRVLWVALAVALALVIAGGAFYISPLGAAMRSRARWFAEDPWGGARPLLWRDSLRMGLARPLFGHGPETFTSVFPHYESKDLARAYPDFAHESPHNIFLDALVSQGIPGLLLLISWCALGFVAAWRIRPKHPAEAAGLAAALAAGIVSQQFTVFTIPTAVIFFATIALAEGLDPRYSPVADNPPAEHSPADPPQPDRPQADRPPAAHPPAAHPQASHPRRYFPFALPLLYFAARIAFADHALALTQRDLASGDLPAATAHYEGSGHADDLWYSRTLAAFAGRAPTVPLRMLALQQAMAAAERATQTAEAPFNAWYSLSALRASQNDAAGAEQCLRAAIGAHPNWFKPHWTLAQVLRFEGRKKEALREALLARDLDGGKHTEVARTLQEISAR